MTNQLLIYVMIISIDNDSWLIVLALMHLHVLNPVSNVAGS